MINILKFLYNFNLIGKNSMTIDLRKLSNSIHFNNTLKLFSLSCYYFDNFKYYFKGNKLNNIMTNIANFKILGLYNININFRFESIKHKMLNKYIEMYNYMFDFQKVHNSFNLINNNS
jgi:hypothetical protein